MLHSSNQTESRNAFEYALITDMRNSDQFQRIPLDKQSTNSFIESEHGKGYMIHYNIFLQYDWV